MNNVDDLNTLLRGCVEEIDNGSQGRASGIDIFGLPKLDGLLGKLLPGQLMAIAARPSMGKKSLLVRLILQQTSSNRSVLMFSKSLRGHDLVNRMISATGDINISQLRSGMLDEESLPKVAMAVGKLKERSLFVCNDFTLTIEKISDCVRGIIKSGITIGLIIIDGIDNYIPVRSCESESCALAELKKIALEAGCPAVITAEINKKVERRPYKRPKLYDIKGPSNVEYAADQVIMIYRDEVYEEDSIYQRGALELIVQKNNNGPIGMAIAHLAGKYSEVRDIKCASNIVATLARPL